jgi:polysaccharide biosynthesis/export protein
VAVFGAAWIAAFAGVASARHAREPEPVPIADPAAPPEAAPQETPQATEAPDSSKLPTMPPASMPADQTYRMSPGDQIEISFYRRYDLGSDPYALDVGDVVSIQVEDHPELSIDTVVRPDGMLTAPLLGDLKAGGVTPDALRAALRTGYTSRVPAPVITVFVKSAQAKLNEFFTTLMSNDEGATRKLAVRPDGLISLPLLGEVMLAGRTVGEMQTELATRYRAIFRYIDISINVASSYEHRITVLGEVAHPGIFPLAGSLSLPQALALAGGYLETAQPKAVYVIRRNPDSSYVGFKIDANPKKPVTGMGAGIVLLPRDIIVVPKSGIASVDKWVDQYIRKVLPFNIGAGVFYTINGGN